MFMSAQKHRSPSFFAFNVHESFACMYVSAPYLCLLPERSEKSVRSPGSGLPDCCELPHACRESNLSPLQEPRVPLAAALSPVPGFSRSDTRFEIGAEDL